MWGMGEGLRRRGSKAVRQQGSKAAKIHNVGGELDPMRISVVVGR